MKKSVLITGANGFVGYHLIKAALNNGLEVIAGVRKNSDVAHLSGLAVRLVTLSFSSESKLVSELEIHDCNYIIHAAGATRARTEAGYLQVNANIPRILGQAAMHAEIPLRKFVFVSSLAAIGPVAYDADAIVEETLPAPVSSYGKSKLLGEQNLRSVKDLPLMIFRPTAVYGPRERDLLIMFRNIHRGIEPYIGRSPQKLSFIHAADLANVIVKGMQIHDNFQTYNISDGNSYGRYELADIVKDVLGKKTLKFHVHEAIVRKIATSLAFINRDKEKVPVINIGKLKELQAPNWTCNIEAVRHDLGFKPEYDLKTGIEQTLEWYEKNNWF